jgi:hypothetical protein
MDWYLGFEGSSEGSQQYQRHEGQELPGLDSRQGSAHEQLDVAIRNMAGWE